MGGITFKQTCDGLMLDGMLDGMWMGWKILDADGMWMGCGWDTDGMENIGWDGMRMGWKILDGMWMEK
jgi:hypothetical protein